MQGDWWSAVGEVSKIWLVACAQAVQHFAVPPPVVVASRLRLSFAPMRLPPEIVNLHLHLRQSLALTSPCFFAEDRDVGVAESIPSMRLKDLIRNRYTLAHTLNVTRVRFLKAGHEFLAVKIEKDVLLENSASFKRRKERHG